jgi:hypothetical protein
LYTISGDSFASESGVNSEKHKFKIQPTLLSQKDSFDINPVPRPISERLINDQIFGGTCANPRTKEELKGG